LTRPRPLDQSNALLRCVIVAALSQRSASVGENERS
jgi:hypothetical protein